MALIGVCEGTYSQNGSKSRHSTGWSPISGYTLGDVVEQRAKESRFEELVEGNELECGGRSRTKRSWRRRVWKFTAGLIGNDKLLLLTVGIGKTIVCGHFEGPGNQGTSRHAWKSGGKENFWLHYGDRECHICSGRQRQ